MIISLLLLIQASVVFAVFQPDDWPSARRFFCWPQAIAAFPAFVFGYAGGWFEGFFFYSIVSSIVAFFWPMIAQFFGLDGGHQEGHLKGALVVDNKSLQRAARKAGGSDLLLSNIPVPRHLENRHFLFTGTTGAGKSQAFYQISEQARARGDGAVVPDVNAEFTARFYREGEDIILSPFDTRSPGWSPLAEMAGPWDSERIAKSIIPEGTGSGAEWNHYAQVLLTAILLKTWQSRGSNGDLAYAILYSTNAELGALVAGTPAQMQFAEGADKMLASIRAILSSYTAWIQDLPAHAGNDAFSISKFVKTSAEKSSGQWLFFPVRDDQFKALRPLIAAWVDISISALLSSSDDENRRVWFFVDEFATWGKIEGIEPLLTKARKKGGVGVLGLQSISQIRDAYGQHQGQTILSVCGTWLTLRCGDAETADYMSKAIGDEQIRRVVNSGSDNGESWGEQYTNQRAVMPAELQSLTDLVGILNIVGDLPAGWLQIPVSGLQKVAEAFMLPDFTQQHQPTPVPEAVPEAEQQAERESPFD